MNKSELVSTLKSKLSDKIKHLQQLIDETRASNNDTKSSMGDKYETGREMLQQEINNLQRQLNEALNQQNSIKKLTDSENKTADFGALVETANGLFYIATSLGEIRINEKKIHTVSSESPLAKALHGKKTGEIFIVNNLSQTIKNIW